jgi:tRNA(His) guanylyltransferase
VTVRTAVYRLFAADNTLLYVGVAEQFGVRWEQHSKLQPWWEHVDHQTVHWYPNRGEAEATEKRAVIEEKPAYNIAGSPWEGGRLHDGTGFYVVPKSPKPKSRNFRAASVRTPPSEEDKELWRLAVIGRRMEGYRITARQVLPGSAYTIVRAGVGGTAESAGTLGGAAHIEAMDTVAAVLCPKLSGAVFAYIQSREITFLLADLDSKSAAPWLDGRVQEMVSLVAATATAEFNYSVSLSAEWPNAAVSRAVFSAGVFAMPDQVEVANYFAWRQRNEGESGRICQLAMTKEAVTRTTKSTGRVWRVAPAEYQWKVAAAPPFAVTPDSFLAGVIPALPTLATVPA